MIFAIFGGECGCAVEWGARWSGETRYASSITPKKQAEMRHRAHPTKTTPDFKIKYRVREVRCRPPCAQQRWHLISLISLEARLN